MSQAPAAGVIRRRADAVEAWRTVRRALLRVICAVGIGAALLTWVFGLVVVRGGGMEPSAGDGDVALTVRQVSDLQANDLVVYRDGSGELQVGRVVALPGDEVLVTDDGSFEVNAVSQPSLTGELTQPGEGGPTYPLTLGEGEYFVLGDGRAQAVDSREVGPLGINEVEGKVIALLRLRGI